MSPRQYSMRNFDVCRAVLVIHCFPSISCPSSIMPASNHQRHPPCRPGVDNVEVQRTRLGHSQRHPDGRRPSLQGYQASSRNPGGTLTLTPSVCFKKVENGSFHRQFSVHSTSDCISITFELARSGGWRVEQAPARRCPQGGAAFASTCATRLRRGRATDLLHPEVKAGLAAPGETELPRERLSHLRNAVYDAANFAARVINPFRHALRSVMFLKRVRRRRAAIAFCPRLLQPSSLSSKGPSAQARPF